MKHIVCVLLVLNMAMTALAATTYEDNYNSLKLKYTIDERSQTATITSIQRANSSINYTGSISIPAILRDCPVTTIGSGALYPSGFSGIGVSITSLVIPENVVEIGERAFAGSCNCTEIKIPTTLRRVGTNAFTGCKNVERVQIEDLSAWCQIDFADDTANPLSRYTATERGLWLFSGYSMYGTKQYQVITTLDIPDGITSLKPYLFAGDSHIYTVNIPASCVEIGEGAFINSAIETVNFSSAVQTIGPTAFYGCSALKGLQLPESVQTIGDYAFAWCKALTELRIPESVQAIGAYAFRECSGLTLVRIPNCVQTIDATAFYSQNNMNGLSNVAGPHRFRGLFISSLSSLVIMSTVFSSSFLP